MRREWYPATHIDPQTCFSFRALEGFHMQTLQGKITSYDYYEALAKLTDNTGVRVKVCSYFRCFLVLLLITLDSRIATTDSCA